MTRRSWIAIHSEVTQKRQCVLASVVRGTVYVQRKPKGVSGRTRHGETKPRIRCTRAQLGAVR
jgi:hypothetical protein